MFESLHDNKRFGGTDVYYLQWHGTVPMYVSHSTLANYIFQN